VGDRSVWQLELGLTGRNRKRSAFETGVTAAGNDSFDNPYNLSERWASIGHGNEFGAYWNIERMKGNYSQHWKIKSF
jgi:hypothetical protein